MSDNNLLPFVQNRIRDLRESEDPVRQDISAVLEVLVSHSEKLSGIETQTKLTNGRVTKQESITADLTERVESIELPLQKACWYKSLLHSALASLVVFLGLLFALMATPLWAKLTESDKLENTIQRAVERAVEIERTKKPGK